MMQLCDDLRVNTTRMVEYWERAVAAEPWILPRQLAKPDFVPDLVAAIAEATVCLPPTRASVLALAETAARHAAGRAAEGADHARVVIEYYFLRNAIWAYFGERQRDAGEDLQAIVYVDIAVSVATRAALLGYYRREFEAQGEWPEALDRLVDEVPLLWDSRPASKAGRADKAAPASGHRTNDDRETPVRKVKP